jgi:phosphoribosylamine--glycine ligase
VVGGYFAGSAPTINPNDDEAIAAYVRKMKIDIIIPARDAELCAGLVDRLTARGITTVGPTAEAAQLEGSKGFFADLCATVGIPSPASIVCTSTARASSAVRLLHRRFGQLPVEKADGLWDGKGVVVPETLDEADAAIAMLMAGGKDVVIQERLDGVEFSFFALSDGKVAVPVGSAIDYKRLLDGSIGPNTGGMGAVSPVPFVTKILEDRVMREVVRPLLWVMARRGTPCRGIIYCGMMLTKEGLKVLEVNVRFGDPEAQGLLPRLDQVNGATLAELLVATTKDGELEKLSVRLRPEAAVCVVMASAGYPEAPREGDPIQGLITNVEGTEVFHAGTKLADDRRTFLTDGGRVLDVVGFAPTVFEARKRAYARVDTISWDGEQHRHDIAEDIAA